MIDIVLDTGFCTEQNKVSALMELTFQKKKILQKHKAINLVNAAGKGSQELISLGGNED